jgi:hypothetical protein
MLILILDDNDAKSWVTSIVLPSKVLRIYLRIVVLKFGSAGRRLVRFQVSKPQSAGDTALLKLTSFKITQSTKALCRASSCHGM